MTQFDERYFDLRVLVQKNGAGNWEINNIVRRCTYKQYFNTSIIESVHRAEVVLNSIFSSDESIEILNTLRNVIIDVASKLENEIGLMEELSVDYGIDINGMLWIIEVNGKPFKKV